VLDLSAILTDYMYVDISYVSYVDLCTRGAVGFTSAARCPEPIDKEVATAVDHITKHW
jgi:hypothetical protein